MLPLINMWIFKKPNLLEAKERKYLNILPQSG